MLSLGVKAYYTDMDKALALSDSIEFYQRIDSVFGKGLAQQTKNLETLVGRNIDSVAIHAPMYKPTGVIDLNKEEDDVLITGTIKVGEALLKHVPSVLYVFHAEGRTMKIDTPAVKQEAIEYLAAKADQISSDHQQVTIENTGDWVNAQMFAGFNDYPALFELVGKNVGMTLDICHLFIQYGEAGYTKLDEFIQTYGDKVWHIHISDMKFSDPVGTEGLQIGEGDLNFDKIFNSLAAIDNKRKRMVIPEIKEGHNNNYAGFNLADKRLRTWVQ